MAWRASSPRFLSRALAQRAALMTVAGASLAGCGGGGGGSPIGPSMHDDPGALTVSYRSNVRVPSDGTVMNEQAFAEQVSRLDPIAAQRCPVSNAPAFQTAADALGGITWTHPVAILKDASQPTLYKGRVPPPRLTPTVDTAGAADDSSAPTIVRPDLVGYQDSTAIFLSQRHGLLAVKTDGPTPVLSCALKLPGQPKYFFYRGSELVLLVNGTGVNEGALLRFRVTASGFDFVDAVMLDDQRIEDARLFDSTLVIYTDLLRPLKVDGVAGTAPSPLPSPTPAGSGASTGTADLAVPRGSTPSSNTGVAVTAVKWDAALTVAWHEELLNDLAASDPFAGQDPAAATSGLAVGTVVGTQRWWKPFISASDRYVVVSRDVSRTVFTGTVTQSYSTCSKSHQGPARSVTYCAPKYEQRPNPDYRAPRPGKDDYDCNGKTLLDCIQQAAPTVSQYIYVRVGESCSTYTYHDNICDAYSTNTTSYPTFRQDPATEFVVYRYDAGDFVKLDGQLYDLTPPAAGATSVGSLAFTGKPLEVAGAIDGKGDLQFQHGHFYVLTDQGQQLHTLLLVGNSIAKLGTRAAPRQNTGWSYSGAHAALFSADRLMVSRGYYQYPAPMGIPNWSDVMMFDLTTPDFPAPINQFVMPGASDQLILANDGVLGPGSVAFTYRGVLRNLQKLTLFSRNDASELGNLLLGTELNADMVTSWLGAADDQRIRLDDATQRLFLPYGGYNHAAEGTFNPANHRLNITAVANQQLTSEVTFDVVEDVIRTVSTLSTPTGASALAFGDSSVYALNQTNDGWSLDTIEELATPLAVYRFGDADDLHARIDRIGARCQISTFAGSLNAFKPDRLAAGPPIPCPEAGWPTAVGLAVVFDGSGTGWQLSADGRGITALDAAAVKERLTHVRHDIYCALDGTVEDGTPVPYLDSIPATVACFPYPVASGSPGLGAGAPATAKN